MEWDSKFSKKKEERKLEWELRECAEAHLPQPLELCRRCYRWLRAFLNNHLHGEEAPGGKSPGLGGLVLAPVLPSTMWPWAGHRSQKPLAGWGPKGYSVQLPSHSEPGIPFIAFDEKDDERQTLLLEGLLCPLPLSLHSNITTVPWGQCYYPHLRILFSAQRKRESEHCWPWSGSWVHLKVLKDQ